MLISLDISSIVKECHESFQVPNESLQGLTPFSWYTRCVHWVASTGEEELINESLAVVFGWIISLYLILKSLIVGFDRSDLKLQPYLTTQTSVTETQ